MHFKKSNKFKTAASLAAVHFLLLGLLANYRFDQVKSFNWDIALMLTPQGLCKNLVFESDHYLAPYYSKMIQLPPDHHFFPFVLLIGSQILLSTFALCFFRKSRAL